jgi:hypothetical protein
MPCRRYKDQSPFFKSLADLDSWPDTASIFTNSVIPYLSRHHPSTQGRLLVFPISFNFLITLTHKILDQRSATILKYSNPAVVSCPLGLTLDVQGGYSEKPEETTYTFNFWSLCDTFI